MLLPVILSGGSGTRLWPVSRKLFPKQFHQLVGASTLLQQTAARAARAASHRKLMVMCNEEHRFLVADQLRGGDNEIHIVLEPQPMNTAPAIAVAALIAHRLYGSVGLLVLPSDHLIASDQKFVDTVNLASTFADKGKLVTFGIVPDAPETGYGYIKKGAPLADGSGFEVAGFREKPDRATAQAFLRENSYFWNSGIFLFRNDVYLDELKKFRPQIFDRCVESTQNMTQHTDFTRIDPTPFSECPRESIDYAVMENTDNAVVVPLETVWSDIGSWSQLANALGRDARGNVAKGDVVTHNVDNTYIHSEQRLVAAVGIRDSVIIETEDVVLVAGNDHDQEVKAVVENLNERKRTEILAHTRVHRPWGCFQTLDSGQGFQVKRLVINPGASISLQLHHQRSEHWVVVRGRASVTRGDELLELHPNESTYIPANTKHKLENRGDGALEVIEVQTGAYLGEDDIVRFDDKYGRI